MCKMIKILWSGHCNAAKLIDILSEQISSTVFIWQQLSPAQKLQPDDVSLTSLPAESQPNSVLETGAGPTVWSQYNTILFCAETDKQAGGNPIKVIQIRL